MTACAASSGCRRHANYTYDPNGNLATKTEGADTWTYIWNAENQLTKVEKNSVEQARFGYDPLGRRVEKVAGGVTTTVVYDYADPIREARGTTTLRYVQDRRVDRPLAVEDGEAMTYFHADGLRSIVKTTDAAGVVSSARQYDAWGDLQAGRELSGYAFTGREWDPETELYYYRARYYDPRVGRFLSEDPVPQPNESLFTYVHNRPVSLVDPTGQVALGPIGGAVAGGVAIWTVACVAYVQHVYERMQNPHEAIDPSQHLKHCIAECEITRNCPGGSDTAAAAGWLREAFGDHDKNDMNAGAQGREVAKERCPRTSCLDGCEQRLKAGKL